MNIIDVKNLTVAFEGKRVFESISFGVERGDYLCVVGENGSGKTTLMRCILGLFKGYSGKIEYKGVARGSIGWLPQRSEAKRDFPACVEEVIMSGFSGKGFSGLFYTAAQKKKAEENMELLEITELRDKAFSSLSGGQQQRVLLCRALNAADSVLLLDEPASGLDSTALDELYSIVEKLNKKGMTVIMISHDIKRSLRYADKILHIAHSGYYFGSAENYLKSDFCTAFSGRE